MVDRTGSFHSSDLKLLIFVISFCLFSFSLFLFFALSPSLSLFLSGVGWTPSLRSWNTLGIHPMRFATLILEESWEISLQHCAAEEGLLPEPFAGLQTVDVYEGSTEVWQGGSSVNAAFVAHCSINENEG